MRTPRPANDNAKARTQVRALHGEVLPPPSPARLQEAFARHAAPCSFRDQVMLLTQAVRPPLFQFRSPKDESSRRLRVLRNCA